MAREAGSHLSSAEPSVQASEAEARAAEQELILQTFEAYFGLLRARAELETAAGREELLKEILQEAQAELDAGSGDPISFHRARTRYDAADWAVIAARNRVGIARQRLVRLTGRPVGDLKDIADPDLGGPAPAEVESWLQMARSNRAALIRAGRRHQAARRERWVELMKGHVNGVGEFPPRREAGREWVGQTPCIPIYRSGRHPADVEGPRAPAAAVRPREASLPNEVDVNVATAFANLETSAERLRASWEVVEAAKISYDATREGCEAGTRTVVDLLTAAQELEEAKRSCADAFYGHLLSRVRLKWAAGILSPLDVATANDLLVR
jgi:outer membrane protein